MAKKIRLSKKENMMIASTPAEECWICDEIVNNIKKDKQGYYIPKKWLEDEGFVSHLQQVIGRKINKLKDVV